MTFFYKTCYPLHIRESFHGIRADHPSYSRNLSSCENKHKKMQVATGFEPMNFNCVTETVLCTGEGMEENACIKKVHLNCKRKES